MSGWFLLLLPLRAELTWKEQKLVLEPPAGAADATGVFEFVNTGKTPVRVINVRSDCGCTAIANESQVVLPGEKGSVRAVFHVGSRKGRQAVSVTVATEEPEVREYALALEVKIREFVTVTPSLLYWKLGDEPTAKTLQLSLAAGFRFVRAESASDGFSVSAAETSGGVVQLRVAPRDTWAKHHGTIRITVAQAEEAPVEVLAFARVL